MKIDTSAGVLVSEATTTKDAATGQDVATGRSWSFSSAADAAKQRAEFEPTLSAADKTKLAAALVVKPADDVAAK